ncbi:peptidase, partial [Paraburkholderia aspalathi]|nr:peptidase [Paraburkholderia aspalathi]
MMIAGAMIAIFCGAMLIAATSDLLSMTIRNRVSLVLAGGFLLLAPLSGMDWSTYGLHLATGC